MAGIADQFQSILGRAASPDELEYFSKFLQEGSIQAHEIGQILQSTPEFQQAQLTKNTAAYGQTLQANDANVMSQAADRFGAQAQSRFAGLGRPNSSAMAAQVFGQGGQLAGQLAQSRQSALADFYGRGLQNNAALYQQGGQSALERGYGLRDIKDERAFQDSQNKYWYNRQQNDYNGYLNAAARKQRNQAWGQAGGMVLGGLLGSGGGAAGVKAGASLGASLGGLAQ